MEKLITRVLFVAAVLLLASSIWASCERSEHLSQISSLTEMYNQSQSSVKIWKNKDSTSQASLRDAMVSIDVLNAVHVKELSEANEKIKGLKKNLSNLQSFTTIGTSTSGTVIATIDTVYVDSSGTKTEKPGFAYSDEWVTMSGHFLRDNSVSIDYSVRDSISVTQYWENPPGFFGFLKPDVLRTDVISENPNSTIKTLKSISIKERPKRFSIVAVGGYGLYQNGSGPFIGIGLGYSLIKF